MTEQKQPTTSTGYLFIIIGIVGIGLRVFISSGAPWTTIAIIKLVFSFSVLAFGLYAVLRKK